MSTLSLPRPPRQTLLGKAVVEPRGQTSSPFPKGYVYLSCPLPAMSMPVHPAFALPAAFPPTTYLLLQAPLLLATCDPAPCSSLLSWRQGFFFAMLMGGGGTLVLPGVVLKSKTRIFLPNADGFGSSWI